jgi:hypothetical protein
MGQKLRSVLNAVFWLRAFHEVEVKLLAEVVVSSEGLTEVGESIFWLTHTAFGRRSQFLWSMGLSTGQSEFPYNGTADFPQDE